MRIVGVQCGENLLGRRPYAKRVCRRAGIQYKYGTRVPESNNQLTTCSKPLINTFNIASSLLVLIIMHSTTLFSALLAGTASALSLPPLIPSISGVTEPLSTDAPPLPILQIPTPPLESPPFVGNQNLKPKKIGYFWTAAGDNNHKDFLATYSLDDDTFGTLLWVTDVPSSGNSPHHLGPSLDGKTLVGGGLLSL